MAETIGLLVPPDRIGAIIGKAGVGLKQARELSGGCKIEVPHAEAHASVDGLATTRRVNFSGDAKQISTAFGLVVQKAFHDASCYVPYVAVRADLVARLIGKGGENLRRVREETSVNMVVERESCIDSGSGFEERWVALYGNRLKLGPALCLALGHCVAPSPSTAAVPCAAAALESPESVRPPSSDAETIQLHAYIQDRHVGALLGKDGAQIKQTAVASGCATVVCTTRDQGARRVVIVGTYDQAISAQGIVFEQLRAAASLAGEAEVCELSVVFFIRREATGAVVGRQGASLTEIREQSGAKIKLEKEEVNGHRPCALAGTLASVVAAEKMVFDIVKAVPVVPWSTDEKRSRTLDGLGGDDDLVPQKRQRALEPADGGETRILVPERAAGALLGKDGTGLRSLRQAFNVGIDLSQPENAEANARLDDRLVTILGPLASRQSAVQALLGQAFIEEPGSMVFKLLVPSACAGAVLGRQGATLKHIRERTGVNAKLEREEVNGDRLLTATGSQAQLSAVVQMALAAVEGHYSPPPPPPAAANSMAAPLPPPVGYLAYYPHYQSHYQPLPAPCGAPYGPAYGAPCGAGYGPSPCYRAPPGYGLPPGYGPPFGYGPPPGYGLPPPGSVYPYYGPHAYHR